jgi:hypothetical protein
MNKKDYPLGAAINFPNAMSMHEFIEKIEIFAQKENLENIKIYLDDFGYCPVFRICGDMKKK